MNHLDELTNEALVALVGRRFENGLSADTVAVELDRTVDVYRRLISSGTDLSYWFERERILNELLDRH